MFVSKGEGDLARDNQGENAATIKMRVRQANWRRGKGESPWKEG